MNVPECHRSALLNKTTDPAGAMTLTSAGCGPVSEPYARSSTGERATRCEPGMTRSGPFSAVNALIHHIADRLRHGPCVRWPGK